MPAPATTAAVLLTGHNVPVPSPTAGESLLSIDDSVALSTTTEAAR